MKSKRAPSVFGKVQRLRRPPSDDDHRVRALLKRLQLIVPEAPKQGRVPQVEMIQHVIDYICDLEQQVVQQLGDKKLHLKRLSPDLTLPCSGVELPSLQNSLSRGVNPADVPPCRFSNQVRFKDSLPLVFVTVHVFYYI